MTYRGWRIERDAIHGAGWVAIAADGEARGPFATASRARLFVDRCLAEAPERRRSRPPRGQLAML